MQKRILLIEDDQMVRETLNLLLSYQGYIVMERSTGSELVEVVSEFKPDLILMDIFLGEHNGRNLCRELKNLPLYQQIPIVIMSGSDDVYNSICEDSANDVLLKPFEERTLLSRIERQLTSNRTNFPL